MDVVNSRIIQAYLEKKLNEIFFLIYVCSLVYNNYRDKFLKRDRDGVRAS